MSAGHWAEGMPGVLDGWDDAFRSSDDPLASHLQFVGHAWHRWWSVRSHLLSDEFLFDRLGRISLLHESSAENVLRENRKARLILWERLKKVHQEANKVVEPHEKTRGLVKAIQTEDRKAGLSQNDQALLGLFPLLHFFDGQNQPWCGFALVCNRSGTLEKGVDPDKVGEEPAVHERNNSEEQGDEGANHDQLSQQYRDRLWRHHECWAY